MNNPKISVIVPVYNVEKYLRRCIDSILAQTFTDFELLLIDDGSKDNSGDICDGYAMKDKRVRVFHKVNGGVSSARNLGLDNMRGKYVTFADSDDWVEESWLSDFAEYAGKADIIFQNAVWHYDDGRTLLRSVSVDGTLCYRKQLALLYPTCILGYNWATLFKANVIMKKKLRYNIQYRYAEDWDFVLSYCLHASSLIVLPSRNYHYYFPAAGSKSYEKPALSRVLVEIEKNIKLKELLKEYADDVVSDVPFIFELMKLYSSDIDKETKLKALSCVYALRPIDKKGKRRIACVSFLINHFPMSLTHYLLLLLRIL